MPSTTLQGSGSPIWRFDIVGTYPLHELGGEASNVIVINNAYLDEARMAGRGTAEPGALVQPVARDGVAEEIDRAFANFRASDKDRVISGAPRLRP